MAKRVRRSFRRRGRRTKRSYRKRSSRGFRMSRQVTSKVGQIFPDRYLVKLKYILPYRENPAAVESYHQFRANSLFDPDLTLAGHQPMGFDQLAALYTQYTVHGCKIKMKIANAVEIPAYVCVYPLVTTSVPTASEAIEQRYSKRIVLGAKSGSSLKTLSHYVAIKKMYNIKDVRDDPELQALTSANPTSPVIWNVFMASISGGDNIVLDFVYELEYFCEFSGPVRLGQS